MAPAHRYLIEFHPSIFPQGRVFFVRDDTTPREHDGRMNIVTNSDLNRAHRFGSQTGAQAQADRFIDIGWDCRVVNSDGFVISNFRRHLEAAPAADTTEWQSPVEYCARCGRSLNADCKCEPIPEPTPPAPEPPAPERKPLLRAADAPRR